MAVDALVAHFLRFREGVPGPLPLIWHTALLAVAQRYKADVTREQKEALKALMHVHSHHAITPEVRRELFSVGCRGDPVSLPQPRAAVGVAATSALGVGIPRSAAVSSGTKKLQRPVDAEY